MLSKAIQTNSRELAGSRPYAAKHRTSQDRAPSVLIWDDDPATAMQLQRVFTLHGCQAKSVNFGNEAYLGFRSFEFDLVVMDYQLSLVDARRALEGVPEWTRVSTPFVLISSEDRRSEARALGFSAFYAKPVLVDTAQDILRRFTSYFPSAPAEQQPDDAPGFPLSRRAQAIFEH